MNTPKEKSEETTALPPVPKYVPVDHLSAPSNPLKREKKEWSSHPGFQRATSPLHEIILTLSNSNKWFQISQIALIFPFAGLATKYGLTYTIALAIFYFFQLVYCCIYKTTIKKVYQHYSGAFIVGNLPESETGNHKKIESLRDKTKACFSSSFFGLIVCLLMVISTALIEKSSNFSELKTSIYFILYGILLPSIITWSGIHYGAKGVGAIIVLIVGGIIDAICEFPVLPFILLLIAICMVYSERSSFADILRFFAVYITAIFIFIFQIGSSVSSLLSFRTNSETFLIITICICLVSTVLTLILKGLGTAINKCKAAPPYESGAVTEPTSEKVMNILYSYVWGGICTVFYVVAVILNCCDDECSLINYGTKPKIPFSSHSSSYDHSYDSGSSYGRGSRYNSNYGSSYGRGSRYNSNYGNSYGSGSNYRYNSYDY